MNYFNRLHIDAVLVALFLSLLSACGGGGGGGGGSSTGAATTASDNVLSVTVDSGPGGNNVNRLYTDVTICQAGSTTLCQTIDHVVVDTGSTGLRILSTALAPGLGLSQVNAAGGFPLLGCAQFLDNSFVWGPVKSADVVLGSKRAGSVSVQIVADPAYSGLAAACSSGTAINSIASLGAKGILGLGLFKEDCGSACASVTANGFYYTCTSGACSAATATTASTSKQLKNPVPLFASDNNGFLIDLPAVSVAGTTSLSGSLIFGIGTQSNNQLASGTVLTTRASGYITTVLSGPALTSSFIDSGSNGIYFDSGSIPTCAGAAWFYCPASLTSLSATLVGANGVNNTVSFFIDNALALFASGPKAVLPTLSGPIGNANIFDWGLPFFYGRRVFVGIEGQPSILGAGPLYAY